MARIESIALRLDNWAKCSYEKTLGGWGFATQSVMQMERVDRWRESDIMKTLDHNEAMETDKAVSSLKANRPELYATLGYVYLAGSGHAGAAKMLGCSIATIHNRLGSADRAIQQWLSDRPAPRPLTHQLRSVVVPGL